MPDLLTPEQQASLLSTEGFSVDKTTPKPAPAAAAPAAVVPPIETPAPAAAVASSAPVTPAPAEFRLEDMDEEALEKELERRGKKVVKPEEFVQSEEEKKKQREADKFRYALDQKVISLDKYNQYQQAVVKDPRQVVFERYVAENPDVAIEKLELDFNRLYFIGVDDEFEDLSSYAQKKLNKEAAQILKEDYPEIYSLDRKYDDHVASEKTAARESQERQDRESSYRTSIDSIFQTLNKKALTIREDDDKEETFDFSFSPDLIGELKQSFLTEQAVASLSSLPQDKQREVIETAILKATFGPSVSYAAKMYHEEKMRKLKIGRKNMNPEETHVAITNPDRDEAAYALLDPEIVAAAQKELGTVTPGK